MLKNAHNSYNKYIHKIDACNYLVAVWTKFCGSVVSSSLRKSIDLIEDFQFGGNEKPMHKVLTILYII